MDLEISSGEIHARHTMPINVGPIEALMYPWIMSLRSKGCRYDREEENTRNFGWI